MSKNIKSNKKFNSNVYHVFYQGNKSRTIKTKWKNKATHMIASADGSIIVGRDEIPDSNDTVIPFNVYDVATGTELCKITRDEGPFDFQPFMTRLSDDGQYLITPTQVNERFSTKKVFYRYVYLR